MEKNVINEINDMKYLFTYNRGKLLSEQEKYEGKEIGIENIDIDYMEYDDEDLNYLKNEIEEEFENNMEDYINEVPSFDSNGTFLGMSKPNEDMEIKENKTKEKERTITIPGTKPGTKPGTPYSPKPGPKKAPKAKTKIPNWLTFDSIGIKIK